MVGAVAGPEMGSRADVDLFQVLDDRETPGTATVSLLVTGLRSEIERLRRDGADVPDPVRVQGFDDLWHCRFADPEGNEVGLLEGA